MAKGGRLRVHVHSGRDLPKMDRFGKSDPYVVVEVDGQTRKTKTLKKTLNPVWKEDFEIRVADSVTSVVTFSCFDWDFADAHDFMGKVEVKIETLLEKALDQFFTLRDEVAPLPPFWWASPCVARRLSDTFLVGVALCPTHLIHEPLRFLLCCSTFVRQGALSPRTASRCAARCASRSPTRPPPQASPTSAARSAPCSPT